MIAFIKNYWYIIVIVISLTGNYFFLFGEEDDYIKEHGYKINQLESKIDSITVKNKSLEKEIIFLELKSDSLDIEISHIEQKRIDIIKSYEYYIKDIIDLDDTELERWFLSRYSDSTGSKNSETSSN